MTERRDPRQRTVWVAGLALVVLGTLAVMGVQWWSGRDQAAPPAQGAQTAPPAQGGQTAPSAQGAPAAAGVQNLAPADFEARLSDPNVVLVNVHIPYEGRIPDTDLEIPFDQIESYMDRLPADRETPLAVYCMSGRMSQIAVAELTRLGYKQLLHLDGGMLAWRQSGRPLEDWAR